MTGCMDETVASIVPPIAASRNVYVASLPLAMHDAEMMNMFAPFGVVLSAKIMRQRDTRGSKGYGFVLFRDESSAVAAVRALNMAPVSEGKALQVRFAHPSASKDLSKQCRPISRCQMEPCGDAMPQTQSLLNATAAKLVAPPLLPQSFENHHHNVQANVMHAHPSTFSIGRSHEGPPRQL